VILFIFWGLNLKAILIFMLAIILGALIMTGVLIIVNTLTFYLGRADMIGSASFEFMISFSIYPKGIFQGVVRLLIYSLIPAAFISHIPLELVTSFSIAKLAIWIVFAVVYFTLACVFFNRGLRKYESGNLIITRM
jgi:ABC-2 type transport system permease protein